MATIAGILTAPNGALMTGIQMEFRLITSPFDGAGALKVGRSVRFTTNHDSAAYSFTLAEGEYSCKIPGTPEFVCTVPTGSSVYEIGDIASTSSEIVQVRIIAWALSEAFTIADSSGLLTSSAITWPDGTPGTYTCTDENVEWGVADAFTLTYVRGGTTLTVTQASVTRDANGVVTNRPALTIA